jgi:hypothetical protein
VHRHPFDPISLVFGLVFATAGLIVLLGGSLVDEGAFLGPTGLIALGLALLYEARRPPAARAGEPGLAGEDGPGDEVGAESGEDGEVEQAGGGHDR